MSRDSADPRTWESTVGAGVDAPAEARRWARWVGDHLSPGRAEDCLLMLTEVVTNAVLHSGLQQGDPIHLIGRVSRDRVRISVCDYGRGFELAAAPELPREDTPGGRGLWIVNRLADRLLVDGSRGRVVFELSRSRAPAGRPTA